MWELDCEEGWAPKNWCFWTVVLGKTLESPLDCKETQPVHPKGVQPWVFFGRTDAEAETPVLWPSHAKSWLIGKDSDAGRNWEQEEKGMTEDEMAEWHHRLDECEFEWTLGVSDGQGGLACCNSWGRKELNTTEPLNWTELRVILNWAESKKSLAHAQILYFSLWKLPGRQLFYGAIKNKGFPGGTSGKEPTCQCRSHKKSTLDPWIGKNPGEGHGNQLQHSRLENPMDRWSLTAYNPWGPRVRHDWSDLEQ